MDCNEWLASAKLACTDKELFNTKWPLKWRQYHTNCPAISILEHADVVRTITLLKRWGLKAIFNKACVLTPN